MSTPYDPEMDDLQEREPKPFIGGNFVEVELDDGTVARWFIQNDRVNDIVDCLTTRLGEPETIRL